MKRHTEDGHEHPGHRAAVSSPPGIRACGVTLLAYGCVHQPGSSSELRCRGFPYVGRRTGGIRGCVMGLLPQPLCALSSGWLESQPFRHTLGLLVTQTLP